MRKIVAGLVLVLGALAAGAGDALAPADDLLAAIDARVGAIGSPAPTPAQAAEAKRLTKARARLAAFAETGLVDRAGLVQIAAAGKLLVQSKTADPGVTAATTALVNALLACLGDSDAEIVGRLAEVYTIADRVKAEALLTSARGQVAAAADLAGSNLNGALTKLLAAATNYAKAKSQVEKTILRLEEQALPNFSDPLTVLNLNGKPAVVSFVAWDVILTPPAGSPIRVKAKFKDFQDPASGYTLPYKLVDIDSELPLYPTFHAALADALGGSPDGSTARGSMRYVSTKHGTVDVPIDFVITAP